MVVALDAEASRTLIATIKRYPRSGAARRLFAVEGLGQSARHVFQLAQFRAGKQVSMRQPPLFQTALQQRDRLLLREISEGHFNPGPLPFRLRLSWPASALPVAGCSLPAAHS